MNDLGKAYVQIVPSAEGIKGKIKDALSGEADSAGNESGNKLGSALIGKLKGIIAAAGIGAFIKSAISEGADLQQSFGGLDTMYGTASDAAKKYAAEASAAGISMNDYAEQAVSFGAALKMAYGGDTLQAAEAANTAILDMADNAAKMGTPLDQIQSAYQGFAKQNYTMLDNLKLGYGGTKSEMERLLADAEKLPSAMGRSFDINNLGDVYDAIHLIQEEMDLTGVAAKEASETISGSFGAVKANLQNFLGTLALGEDIKPALENLVQSTSVFLFNNLIPAFINVISELPNAFKILVSSIGTILSENSGTILETAQTIFESVITFLQDNGPQLLAQGLNMIVQFASGLIQNLPTIIAKGSEIVGALASGLIQSVSLLIKAALNLIGQLVNAFFNTNWANVGINILQGIADGIIKAIPGLIEKAIQACKGLTDSIKSFFGIKSPSRLFRDEIGQWLPKGMAIGIETNMDSLYDAVDEMDQATFGALKGGAISVDTGNYYKPNNTFVDRMDKLMEKVESMKININNNTSLALDGQTIAKASAPYTQTQLDRLTSISNKLKGVK